MARRLTTRETATEYHTIIKSLQPRQWNKYMRFLGLSEHDIQPLIEKGDKYQMLNSWQQKMGILTPSIVELLKSVAEEVKHMERNLQLDAKFQTKLALNRDKAWLLYGPVHYYTGQDNWNDIVRLKLYLTDADMAQIHGFAEKDVEEQKYQQLLTWIQKQGLVNARQIAGGLSDLDLVIPPEFGSYGVVVER